MSERIVKPSVDDEVIYQDLCALIEKHRSSHPDTSEIMLAIAAQIVGKIIALQDQRTMTSERAFKIVAANIEAGNEQMIGQMDKPIGRA